jgi:ribosomal protein S18 acetylase RimI-like enzyme
VKIELDILFNDTMEPSSQEQQELSLLRARCKDKDGFEPGIQFDTSLNAVKSFKPWLLAKAAGEDGTKRIAGAACIFLPTCSEAEISACVDPLFRGQGVFAQLFRRAIVLLRDANVPSALLVSDARLSYGQAIAAKLGIKRSHTEKTMARELTAIQPDTETPHAALIKLLPVTQDTLEQAARLSAAIFDEPIQDARSFLSACLTDPWREPMLAIGARSVVGMVSLVIKDNAYTIYGLGVMPDMRRQGYGGAILDSVIAMLTKRSGNKISLDVCDQNNAATALCKSRGFAVESLTEYWRIDLARLR